MVGKKKTGRRTGKRYFCFSDISFIIDERLQFGRDLLVCWYKLNGGIYQVLLFLQKSFGMVCRVLRRLLPRKRKRIETHVRNDLILHWKKTNRHQLCGTIQSFIACSLALDWNFPFSWRSVWWWSREFHWRRSLQTFALSVARIWTQAITIWRPTSIRFEWRAFCFSSIFFNPNNNYSPQSDHKIYFRPRTACSWPMAQNFPSKGYSTCPYLYHVPWRSCGANLWQHQMGFGRDSSRGLFAQTLNLITVLSWVMDKDQMVVLSTILGLLHRIELIFQFISRNRMVFFKK